MEAQVNITKWDKLFSESEFNRFGLICVILLIVGCLGGIAVGLGAINSVITLTLVVVPTMITLSMLLAVAPMKSIFTFAALATLIDLLLIIYFIFA